MSAPHRHQPVSYAMPPADLEATFPHVPNYMAYAQSQLLRRPSSSSHTSTSSRRGSAKITKANSVGNSPHGNPQRRRTTTSQTPYAEQLGAQHKSHMRVQRYGNNYNSQGQLPSGRPMSWHPGSRSHGMNAGLATECLPINKPATRNTIMGLETLAVPNDLAVAFQPFPDDYFAMQPEYFAERPSTAYEQSIPTSEGFGGLGFNTSISYSPYPSYQVPTPIQYPDVSLAYGFDAYCSMRFQTPDWTQDPTYLDNYTVPQTPDFLPIQHPLEAPRSTNVQTMQKKKSKELVGMGLYDDIDQDALSTLSLVDSHASNYTATHQRESLGKGLKLEETWEPPQNIDGIEDEEDEEDASSTDEADEDLPLAFTHDEAQAAFYPPYGDLSNQTFFFDNDDQYTNCMAFDQTVQVCQPKAPNPVIENSLWF